MPYKEKETIIESNSPRGNSTIDPETLEWPLAGRKSNGIAIPKANRTEGTQAQDGFAARF